MIEMRTETRIAGFPYSPARELGRRWEYGPESLWAEWSRCEARSTLASAIQLYEELLQRSGTGHGTWAESTVSPAESLLSLEGGLHLGAIATGATCDMYLEVMTRATSLDLSEVWQKSAQRSTGLGFLLGGPTGFVIMALPSIYEGSCKSAAARLAIQSAESIVEDLISLEYPGPQLELIASRYSIAAPSQVFDFIWRHPYVQPALIEGLGRIREYFPSGELSLEIASDPEVEGWDELVIVIATAQSVDEAADALDRLDQEWWLEALVGAQGKLSIDLEFE